MEAIRFYVLIVWYSFFIISSFHSPFDGEKCDTYSRATIKQPVWGKQLTCNSVAVFIPFYPKPHPWWKLASFTVSPR